MNGIPDAALTGSMSSQHLDLHKRIWTFAIDEPDISFPFSKRLARDQGWSLTYTQQVIEEYKKFLFLAIAADHPVTPSDAVDEAWHLHLTYTHSYWDDLCSQILQKPLHHHPTKGGTSQREVFWDCYNKTLNSYERFFGYPPPADIWQPPTIRFRQAGQFRRVNSQDFWFIPKPSLKIFRLVSWRIPHLSWRQVIAIALLALSWALSWHFLYHQVIAIYFNIINFFINQPAFAQVSSSPDSYTPSQPNVESYQLPDWEIFLGVILIGFSTAMCVILGIVDSRCPKCKRLGAIRRTKHVLHESTNQHEGKQLITQQCSYCHYKQQWDESIPRLGSNDSGCGGCGM